MSQGVRDRRSAIFLLVALVIASWLPLAQNGVILESEHPGPKFTSEATGVSSVSAGSTHTCAVLDNASLYCWGWNSSGSTPDAVSLPSGRTAASVSGGAGTCAVLDDGSLYCGGFSDGSTANAVSLPSGRTAASVSAGMGHICAVLDDGSLYCWGDNGFGQLGDGTTTSTGTPVAVSLPSGRTAASVSAGAYHTCAVLDNASLYCWGQNDYGMLGDGTVTANIGNSYDPIPGPVSLPSGRTASSVSLGEWHACTVLDNASLYCWGQNGDGQLGTGGGQQNTPAAVLLPSGRTVTSVSAGEGHTCAVLDNASLYCWGWNGYGMLGDGTFTNRAAPVAVNLPSGRTAVAVSAGGGTTSIGHTCAVLDNDSLYCWGHNGFGQLGDGTTTQQLTPQLVDLGLGGSDPPDPRSVVSVSAGHEHTCSVMDDGALLCWGSGSSGQLGDGGTTFHAMPNEVDLGSGRSAVSVSAGSRHTCAILDDGSLKCWGNNPSGQLGLGHTQSQLTPSQVNLGAGRTAVAVSGGSSHTCAILDDGSLKCWGMNNYGQIGDGSIATRLTPRPVNLGLGMMAVEISLGSGHTCAILNDSSVKCWGANYDGQLGDGTQQDRVTPTSVQLDAGRTAVAISASSERFTCAALDNGSVACWGNNGNGQQGHDNSTNQLIPSYAGLDLSDVAVDISIGGNADYQTCAVMDSGTLKCWGSNSNGQLGDGCNLGDTCYTPTQINLGAHALSVSVGNSHVCATLSNGWLSCWGGNEYGQLGDGSSCGHDIVANGCNGEEGKSLPRRVYLRTQTAVLSVSAGSGHTCATLTNGSVACWGSNNRGQLGDGTVNERHTPTVVEVDEIPNWALEAAISVDVGLEYSCATYAVAGSNPPSYGQLWCWGDGVWGQLQNESENNTPLPVNVSADWSGFGSGIGAGHETHVCFMRVGGDVKCWGRNINGSIGDGSPVSEDYDSGIATGLHDTQAISAGSGHTCIIEKGGSNGGALKCWGRNDAGQIGEGSTIDATIPSAIYLGSGRKAISVSAGPWHTCAVLDDSTLKCWGANWGFQLGSGVIQSGNEFPVSELTPIPVNLGGQSVVGVASGYAHTCAILDGGSVSCWGDNEFGQIGDGTNDDVNDSSQASVVNLGAGRTAVSIDAGYYHTCAVLDDYSLKCWGLNDHGQIGDGSTNNSNSPVRLSFGVDSAGEEGPIEDMDEDGIPDSSDDDMDGDGILNIEDDFPTDSTEWGDADSDGTGDNADTDDDNDGWSDMIEGDCFADPLDSSSNPLDSDEDGECDEIDSDDDNDGVADETDAFPIDSSEWDDNDLDGVGDNADTDDDNDGWSDEDELSCGNSTTDSDSVPSDTDGDGLCDALEDDSDNDSFIDDVDIFPYDQCAAVDIDGDGMPDWILLNCNTTLIEDSDDDNDGYLDTEDDFPEDSSEWSDNDWDGVGDNADTDDDDDGVPDEYDEFPFDGSEWEDNDGDGTGDNADTDDDNDGVEDSLDAFPYDAAASIDTDGDGMPDSLDTNITTDLVEDMDDDGDGWLDVYDEFPLDSTEWVDTDADGIGNNADMDDDGDGWSDSDEYLCDTNHLDYNDVPSDEDNDGVCDEDEGEGSLSSLIKLIPGGGMTVVGLLLLLAGAIFGGSIGRRNAFELARRDAEKAILWTDEYEGKEDKEEEPVIEDLSSLADDLDDLYELTKE